MSEVRVLEELEKEGWIWIGTCPIRDGSEGRKHLLSSEERLNRYNAVYGDGRVRIEKAFDREGGPLQDDKWVDVYVK